MRDVRCFIAVVPLLAMACAQPPVPPPASQQTVVPTRETFAARAATQPVTDGWLGTFKDPRLDRLVEEAVRNNSDLAIAAARRDEADARVLRAQSALSPKLDAGGSASRGDPGTGNASNQYNLGLRVQWEIDVWGRLRGASSAAQMDFLVAQADYQYARQSLAAATARAWFLAITARRELALNNETLAMQKETQRITDLKFKQGLAKQLDLDLSQANVAAASEVQKKSQGTQEDAVRALEVLLGRYPSAELAVADDLPPMPGLTPAAGVPSQLLERRPDLIAADREVAAAFYRVGSAKAAQLPTIAINASAGTLLDPSSAIWNIGANLLAPIYDGGQRRADVKITEARQKQALAAYVKAAINAFREVETALANEAILVERQDQLVKVVSLRESAYKAAKARYDSGDMTILELNQVQRDYIVARADLLRVQNERLLQRVNLFLSLGGSFDSISPTTAPTNTK